ncbi:MAG: Rieske 2Fe-2S domain-containing protein [Pseudomonadota bacterium]
MALTIALDDQTADLVQVASLAELSEKGSKVIKVGRKQILLWHGNKGVFACNNRCPHEGYPLKEGTVSDGCILTCNWHNWKFDLESGDTLVGGDKLRRYPVELRGDEIWLDVSDPSGNERADLAIVSLKDSFRRLEYDRMAREIARLKAAGADPLDAIRSAFAWTHDHLEYGTTHAQAAAADWLAMRQELATDEADDLVPLVEIVGHLAYDSLREQCYPFPQEVMPYNQEGLVAAIEEENEDAAIAYLRGALKSGLSYGDLLPALARAALTHYADFGHSAIYVYKTGQLIDHIGPEVAEPLLLALVRSLCYAFREDLIPEFRGYQEKTTALAANLSNRGKTPITAADFRGLSAKRAMALCVESKASQQDLFDALLGTAAWNMLYFDRSYEQRSDRPVSDNVGWLDFTV